MKRAFIKGGALTFAIFLLLVSLIISGTLLTIVLYHRNFMEQNIARQNLLSYSQSLLSAALSDSTLSFPWDGKSAELTTDERYSFNIHREFWGAYALYTVSGKYGNYPVEKKVMAGTSGFLDDNAALYLAENNNALAISGTTQLVGDCYLPKAGIKATYMEGDYYRGKKWVYGDIKESQQKLPPINKEYIIKVQQWLNGKMDHADSLIWFQQLTTNEMLQSFFQKAVCICSQEPVYLNRCTFEGHILIFSKQSITVFDDARLTDVILVAPKIEFKKGWSGSIQAYAGDTLLCDNNVHFTFPSTLGVASLKNSGFIQLGDYNRLDGTLWMVQNREEKQNKNRAELPVKTLVHGLIYVDGSLWLKGSIEGSLYVKKILYQTPSSYYENHLYNTVIDIHTLLPYDVQAILNEKRSFKPIKVLLP